MQCILECKRGSPGAINIGHTCKVKDCIPEYRGTDKDWEMLSMI